MRHAQSSPPVPKSSLFTLDLAGLSASRLWNVSLWERGKGRKDRETQREEGEQSRGKKGVPGCTIILSKFSLVTSLSCSPVLRRKTRSFTGESGMVITSLTELSNSDSDESDITSLHACILCVCVFYFCFLFFEGGLG